MNCNTLLVEKFGKLEKLCNEQYGDTHGVTLYISDMEALRSSDPRTFKTCDYDCRRLKEIRDKRNKLSHGDVSFDTPYATSEDIEFVINFRERILSQTDPLAMLRRASETCVQKNKKHSDAQSGYTPSPPPICKPAREFDFGGIGIALGIAAAIAALVLFLLKL